MAKMKRVSDVKNQQIVVVSLATIQKMYCWAHENRYAIASETAPTETGVVKWLR